MLAAKLAPESVQELQSTIGHLHLKHWCANTLKLCIILSYVAIFVETNCHIVDLVFC